MSMKTVCYLLACCLSVQVVHAQATTANIAVIMVDFPTYESTHESPWTEDQLLDFGRASMAQVEDYYAEVSYGRFVSMSTVFGVYHLALDRYATRSAVAQAAQSAAASAGVDLAPFTVFVYVSPVTDFVQAGYGDASGVWIAAADYPLLSQWYVVAHELGHAWFSIDHSDIYSVMGGGHGHFCALNKERFGWLGAADPVARIQTITSSGDYLLKPYESASISGPLALKVVGSKTYYLEYRQPVGFDAFTFPGSQDQDLQGVFVHYSSFNDPVYVANGSPGPAWGVGRTYCDKSAKLSLTVVSEAAEGAVVRVKFKGNCR